MTDHPTIPDFREVEIPGGDELFDDLRRAVSDLTASGWTRDVELEQSPQLSQADWIVYRRAASEDKPALAVFLAKGKGRAYVSNIVPTEKSSLSHDEYNQAALEFSEHFVKPAAESLGLVVSVGPEELDLSTVLDPEVFRALRAFSVSANRSTGSAHPLDQRRWFEFILAVHESGNALAPSVLAEWLVADGWGEEIADELAIEFENGLELLQFVREQRGV